MCQKCNQTEEGRQLAEAFYRHRATFDRLQGRDTQERPLTIPQDTQTAKLQMDEALNAYRAFHTRLLEREVLAARQSQPPGQVIAHLTPRDGPEEWIIGTPIPRKRTPPEE